MTHFFPTRLSDLSPSCWNDSVCAQWCTESPPKQHSTAIVRALRSAYRLNTSGKEDV